MELSKLASADEPADGLKRLRMFAGPNGSGKTSLVKKLAVEFSNRGLFPLYRFINADELYDSLRAGNAISLSFLDRHVDVDFLCAALVAGGRLSIDHPFLKAVKVQDAHLTAAADTIDAYVAASIADLFRAELLAAGSSFSFETVMSHRSKTEFFARAASLGYRNYLYFIATDAYQLNIQRVLGRTNLGGHNVPEQKIIERYERCLKLVGEALRHAYRAFVFDNSGFEPVWLAELTPQGAMHLKVPRDQLPNWFTVYVAPSYPDMIAE